MTALLDKINVIDIVAEHFSTLVDSATGKLSKPDIVLFYVAPLIPLAGFVLFDTQFADGSLGILATGLSILAGLLFNLLVLLHSLEVPKKGDPFDRLMTGFIGELHANIAYAVVVSLVALVPLVIASNYPLQSIGRRCWGIVTMFLAVHFALTMGMVLKRMHTMLDFRAKNR